MSLPSAAKTPVRSVSTPTVMVLPSTPTSVVTLPALPPPPLDPLSALVLQPVAATTRATPISAAAREYFRVLICWCSLALDDRTDGALVRSPGRRRASAGARRAGPRGVVGTGARYRPARRVRRG